jgi:hypothetical protein
VSDTYTAVYERDGEAWTVEIAEEPGLRCRFTSVAEARRGIRDALAQRLGVDISQLSVVDDFRLPAQIRTVRQEVRSTRTECERAQLITSMTDSKPAMSWAEELDISERDPVTVHWLKHLLGDKEVSIDTFCHTITMAEEMARLVATTERTAAETTEKD